MDTQTAGNEMPRISFEQVMIQYEFYQGEDSRQLRAGVPDGTISKRLESLVDSKLKQGYRLVDWNLSSTSVIKESATFGVGLIQDLIVAVFELDSDLPKS